MLDQFVVTYTHKQVVIEWTEYKNKFTTNVYFNTCSIYYVIYQIISLTSMTGCNPDGGIMICPM